MMNEQKPKRPELLEHAHIYIITNRVNGKQYVGRTIGRDPMARVNQHLDCDGGSEYLMNSVKYHGRSSFDVELIPYPGVSNDALNSIEVWKITQLGTLHPNGYNLTQGGEGGVPSEIVRQKMSAAIKEALKRPEVKERRSAAMKEVNKRPEVKERQSAAQKEAQNRPEVKERKSAAMKEVQNRPEVKAKRAATNNRPEVKERKSAAMKEVMNRPEVKAKHAATNKRKRLKRIDDLFEVMSLGEMTRLRNSGISWSRIAKKAGITFVQLDSIRHYPEFAEIAPQLAPKTRNKDQHDKYDGKTLFDE